MAEKFNERDQEMSIQPEALVVERLAGLTEQQLLDVALEELERIRSEMGDLEPGYMADLIVQRTGVDFETAALATFS